MTILNESVFYSGTSGIVSKIPKKLYPPAFQDKSRLHYYSKQFNSVEVNSTFYKLPQASTVQKWYGEAEPGFRFAFKIPKAISHAAELKYNKSDLHDFLNILGDSAHRVCLLIQFPSGITVEKLPELKTLLKEMNAAHVQNTDTAIEFRHNSWYVDEVYDALRKFNTAVVDHDFNKGRTPAQISTSNFKYFRFHGPETRYRGSYSDEFMFVKAEEIKHLLAAGETVYAYFNNTMGNAYNNLVTLNDFVNEKVR